MPRTSFLNPKPLLLCTLLATPLMATGCNKNHDEARANATSATSMVEAQPITEFSSLEATAWANGSPASLGDAHGKNVVLIEAWHPT